MEENIKIKLLILTLERIDKNINLANLKASFALPANAVLLGFLIQGHLRFESLLINTFFDWLPNIVHFSTILCILISIIFSIYVIIASLKSRAVHSDYCSMIFFGSIAKMDLDTFSKNVNEITRASFIDDLTRQVHLLSGISSNKFIHVNISMVFLLIAFLLPIITLFLDKIL